MTGPPGPPGYPGYGQTPPQGPWGQAPWRPGYGGWTGAGQSAPAAPGAQGPGGVPLRPLGVGDILSGSFTLIRQNPAATLGLTASIVTALTVAVLVTFLLALGTTGALMLLALPVVVAAFALQAGGLTAALGCGLLGRRLGIAEAVRRARAGWVLCTILVLALAAAAIWVALIAALKGWGVIPALLLTAWLAVMTSLAIPVAVLERRGPFAAIGRSWRLVSGSYWRVFGVYLLMCLMVWAISFVVNFPLGFATGLLGGAGSGSGASVSIAVVLSAIGEIVIASLAATIEFGVIVLVYADMRMRKEGMDLVLRQAAEGRQLTGEEYASSGFTSAYTGGARPGTAWQAAPDWPRPDWPA